MPSFPDSAFLFSTDVSALASQVPASFSILSLQGLTLLALCLESRQGVLRLTVKLPCVPGSVNPVGSRAQGGLSTRLLSTRLPSPLRQLLTLPAIEWISIGQQAQEMQASGFLDRQQLLVQGHIGKQVCVTLTGAPGPGPTIPLGRLPTRLPINPSPAKGLLGMNRHIKVSGPGTLTLSLGGHDALCDSLRAAQLDESSPLLLLSC